MLHLSDKLIPVGALGTIHGQRCLSKACEIRLDGHAAGAEDRRMERGDSGNVAGAVYGGVLVEEAYGVVGPGEERKTHR